MVAYFKHYMGTNAQNINIRQTWETPNYTNIMIDSVFGRIDDLPKCVTHCCIIGYRLQILPRFNVFLVFRHHCELYLFPNYRHTPASCVANHRSAKSFYPTPIGIVSKNGSSCVTIIAIPDTIYLPTNIPLTTKQDFYAGDALHVGYPVVRPGSQYAFIVNSLTMFAVGAYDRSYVWFKCRVLSETLCVSTVRLHDRCFQGISPACVVLKKM